MKLILETIDQNAKRARVLNFPKEIEGREVAEMEIGNGEKLILGISRNLSKELSKGNKVSLRNLKLVPLYKNCMIDYSDKTDNSNNLIVNVRVPENKEIATVKLNGVLLVTPIIQDNDIATGIHEITFAAVAEKDDWEIIIYTIDQTKLKITAKGSTMTKAKIKINKQAGRLKGRKLLKLPKKVYVVGTDYKKERKEGFISILAIYLLNEYTTVNKD